MTTEAPSNRTARTAPEGGLSDLIDLRGRIERGRNELQKMARNTRQAELAEHYRSKADGLNLALGYIDEMIRRDSA